MSTVTLSKPHWAMTSAEKPDGIASQALTQALPDFSRALSLFIKSPLAEKRTTLIGAAQKGNAAEGTPPAPTRSVRRARTSAMIWPISARRSIVLSDAVDRRRDSEGLGRAGDVAATIPSDRGGN